MRQRLSETLQALATDALELRRLTIQRDAASLADCARAMARSFSGGGRLFAMGNGGSSTDAQAVAERP
jgi:D-sedoheptulose 7-phosphate isomerase